MWGPVKLGITVLITPDGTPTLFHQSCLHKPFDRPPHIVQRMLQLKGKEIWEIRLSPNRESPRSGAGCLCGSSGVSRPVHVLGGPHSVRALEEALPAELFLEEGTVLVKSSLNPGHTAFLTHPQLLAHQPDEALIMGYQNHATLKDTTGALRGMAIKGR